MVIAVPIAALFWVRRQWTFGTVIGAGVLLSGALFFGGLEYVGGLQFRIACEQTGTPCAPSNPSDFVRISVYGIVAMLQVMMLFVAAGGWSLGGSESITMPSGGETVVTHNS